MVTFDAKYVRATHVMHTEYGIIEFKNYLDRESILYRMSDVSDALVPGSHSVLFDMVMPEGQSQTVADWLAEYEKLPLHNWNFIGEKSGVVWWCGDGQYWFISPLGTKISICPNHVYTAEVAYTDFDEDEYAISKYGQSGYPMDLQQLVDDGRVIKRAYLDLISLLKKRM